MKVLILSTLLRCKLWMLLKVVSLSKTYVVNIKVVDFVSTFILKVVILSTKMLKVVNVVNTFVEKIVGESATN